MKITEQDLIDFHEAMQKAVSIFEKTEPPYYEIKSVKRSLDALFEKIDNVFRKERKMPPYHED